MAEALVETIPCEICHTQVTLNDWTSHSGNCVRPRPANAERIGRDPDEESNEHGIPCEFCEATISLNDWDSHSRECADAYRRRNNAANSNVLGETALIPCEYCDQLVGAEDWDQHSKECFDNHRRCVNTLRQSLDSEDHGIPCEYCDQSFPLELFETHQTECRYQRNAAFQGAGVGNNQIFGAAAAIFPSTWELSLENLSRFTLAPGSEEYKFVAGKFSESLKQNPIVQIERIQNRRWYRQYDAHREDFIERYGRSTEEWLFHGCKSQSVDAIVNDCFNRSHAARCAVGQGIYFASQAATSLSYTQPDSDGIRHMFMARVLLGKTTDGNATTRVCPPGFDTTGRNQVYVTYHDAQAYGEYLIAFR